MEEGPNPSEYIKQFNELVACFYKHVKFKHHIANMSMKYYENSTINNSEIFDISCLSMIDNLEISIGADLNYNIIPKLLPIMINSKEIIINITIVNSLSNKLSLNEFVDMLKNMTEILKNFSIVYGKPISIRVGLEKPYEMNKEKRHTLSFIIWDWQNKIKSLEFIKSVYNVYCSTNDVYLQDACKGVIALTPDNNHFIKSNCPYQFNITSCKDCGFLK